MQLESYGGATGIRDSGLLESAVMTADYAFHIAENQPFVDGNKRTALSSALVFLDWQNVEINDPQEELFHAMIGLAQKTLDKAGLAALLLKLSK